MAIAQGLRRLLRVREIEEEQSRIALDAALGNLGRLEAWERAARSREQRGRRLLTASASSGDAIDRRAAVEEIRGAGRATEVVRPRIAEARWVVTTRQAEYLSCRAQRRQVETLIQEAEARQAVDAERRRQQALDDWFRNRRLRHGAERKSDRGGDLVAKPIEPGEDKRLGTSVKT